MIRQEKGFERLHLCYLLQWFTREKERFVLSLTLNFCWTGLRLEKEEPDRPTTEDLRYHLHIMSMHLGHLSELYAVLHLHKVHL